MQEILTGVAAPGQRHHALTARRALKACARPAGSPPSASTSSTTIVKPGVTTQAIDDFILDFGLDHGALPATLNYRGYRKSSCTSINHVVCHGIPNEKPLREGDIVNIDVTFVLDGWHGDSSRMYAAGQLKRAAERLIEVTYECLMRGVAAIRPGGRLGDIGHAIQTLCGSRALLGGARFLRPRRRPRCSTSRRTCCITGRPAKARRSGPA